jgi:hypothetical protein
MTTAVTPPPSGAPTIPLPAPQTAICPIEPLTTPTRTAGWTLSVEWLDLAPIVEAPVKVEHLLNTLHARYGYVLRNTNPGVDGQSVRKRLGDFRSELSPEDVRSIYDWEQATEFLLPPRPSWQSTLEQSSLKMKILHLADRTIVYQLKTPFQPPVHPHILVVRSSCTAFEMVRRGSLLPFTWVSTLQFLISHCMAFKTLKLRDITNIQVAPTIAGPSNREMGWKAGPADYSSWKSRCRQFLRSPRGRAAWLHGGLITRLAIYLEGGGIERVLDGPSSHAGIVVQTTIEDYIDDELTAEEAELLSGTFHVKTGMFTLPVQYIYDDTVL